MKIFQMIARYASLASLCRGEQLYSAFCLYRCCLPFFEKLIQSLPLPGLQNFQSMSMGKRNRSLDEGGGAGWLLVFRNHSISRFVSRKIFSHPRYRAVYIFPDNRNKFMIYTLRYFLQPRHFLNHL